MQVLDLDRRHETNVEVISYSQVFSLLALQVQKYKTDTFPGTKSTNADTREVISYSQRKIFELENTIAALRKEKEALKNLVDSGVESVKTMKKELKDAQVTYHCVCVCVCLCVCVHTYIHAYIHTYVYTYINIQRERERDRDRDKIEREIESTRARERERFWK
jgi:hypothetical protein